MCTIEDLKEMGIPLGPRKKIAKFVKERVNKQVSLSAEYLQGLQNCDYGPAPLMVSCSQAARQAAQENKKEVKEVTQTAAPPPAAEVPSDPTVKKLPVGSTVSSVHVDYNYFEVGTGQVNTSVFQQQ